LARWRRRALAGVMLVLTVETAHRGFQAVVSKPAPRWLRPSLAPASSAIVAARWAVWLAAFTLVAKATKETARDAADTVATKAEAMAASVGKSAELLRRSVAALPLSPLIEGLTPVKTPPKDEGGSTPSCS